MGWGAVGLDKKRQAERTGLNNQGWHWQVPAIPYLPTLVQRSRAGPSCRSSAKSPRLVSAPPQTYVPGITPGLFLARAIPGPARESLEKTEIRRGGLWAWGRRGRSGEAGTRSAGVITRPLLAGAARPRSGGAPLQVSHRLWSFIGRS